MPTWYIIEVKMKNMLNNIGEDNQDTITETRGVESEEFVIYAVAITLIIVIIGCVIILLKRP